MVLNNPLGGGQLLLLQHLLQQAKDGSLPIQPGPLTLQGGLSRTGLLLHLPGGLAGELELLLLLESRLATDYLMTSHGTLTSSDGTWERESGSRFN